MIMWIHIFGSADMCICLCKDTGAMNRPLRLAECFVRHFVGVRGYLRSVREAFRGWVWVFCGMLGTVFGF